MTEKHFSTDSWRPPSGFEFRGQKILFQCWPGTHWEVQWWEVSCSVRAGKGWQDCSAPHPYVWIEQYTSCHRGALHNDVHVGSGTAPGWVRVGGSLVLRQDETDGVFVSRCGQLGHCLAMSLIGSFSNQWLRWQAMKEVIIKPQRSASALRKVCISR